MSEPRFADTESDIALCFDVMQQLRPSLVREHFVATIHAQQSEGYRLAFLEDQDSVVTVAGFRVQHMLFSGKTFYVDDLVTGAASRSQGHGETMLKWLIAQARAAGCSTFSLDSGTQRKEAHAFYLRNRLRISSFHFDLPL